MIKRNWLIKLLATTCLSLPSVGNGQVPAEELGISLEHLPFLREFNSSFEVGLRPGAPALDPRESVILSVVADMYLTDLDGAIEFIQEEVRREQRRIQQDRSSRGAAEEDSVYSANIEYAIGQLYQLRGNSSRAEQFYLQAIEKYPAYVDAYIRMMEMYLTQEDCDKARSAGLRALELGGSNGFIFKGLGICHFIAENYNAALDAFRVARTFQPNDETTTYYLALSALNSGNSREAALLLDELIAADEANVSYYMLQVNAFLQEDDYESALQAMEIARRLGLLTSSNYGLLGSLFISKQMSEMALAVLLEGLSQSDSPDFRETIEQFDQLSVLQDWDSSESFLLAIERAFDSNLNAGQRNILETRRAQIFLARDQRVEAADTLRQVVESSPTNGSALLSLAQLFRLEQDYEQAGIYYQRASNEEDVALSALTEYAQLAADREDWQLAIDLLTQATTVAPLEAVPTIEGNIRALLRVQEFAE